MRLRIHGQLVTGRVDLSRHTLVQELLSIPSDTPPSESGQDRGPPKVLSGISLRLSLLRDQFNKSSSEDVDDGVIRTHAHAYILALMGSFIFSDKSGNVVYLFLPILRNWRMSL